MEDDQELKASLARIEARQADDVPPADVRASMAEATEHVTEAEKHHAEADAQAAPRDALLAEVIEWVRTRMSGDELEQRLEQQYVITKQLISIMQGTRDDFLALRTDFRRLATLLEQSFRDREQEPWSGEERRRAGGF
jgi:hypothetical protein